MPYITKARRADVRSYLVHPVRNSILAPQDAGELNFALTIVCLRPLDRTGLREILEGIVKNYLLAKPLRYQRINDVVGACECASLELDRRLPQTKKFAKLALRQVASAAYDEIGVPYERTKIEENGDIAEYGEAK